MSIKEYDILPNGTEKCEVCGSKEDVIFDEDGEPICTDCLFYNETMQELHDEDMDLLGY